MNPRLATDLVACHIRDLRRLAGQRPNPSHPAEPRPLKGKHRRSRLRSRIGFTLVEAGLHLLAGSADPGYR